MNNFVQVTPTKIIFGKNTIQQTGRETALYGKRVLLVTGKASFKESGYYDLLLASLTESGCHVVELSGVSTNPTLSKVYEGIDIFRSNSCDCICAAGGGSVIDTGKAISCGVPVDHDVWKFFTAKKKLLTTIPLIAVSTLAGAGSENNSGMVMTNEEKKVKLGYGNRLLFPRTAILDPTLTFSVSVSHTGYGAADIMSHLLEFSCNNALPEGRLPFQLMSAVTRSVIDNCRRAQTTPTDYSARAELLWASTLSLSGLFSAGLGRIGFPAHLIEHGICASKNSTHGAGLSVILPLWMRYMAPKQPEMIAAVGKNIFGLNQAPPVSMARETAQRLSDTFRDMHCPTSLKELGVDETEYKEIAENCQQQARLWRLREYTVDTIIDILKMGQ